MLSEAPSIGTRGLSPRAGVALLTLQLRASLQEAAAAEAAEAEADHEAAREELRAQLEPLVAERRRALDAALAQARAEAAAAVAAARRAASVIVANASSIAEVNAPTEPVALPFPQVVTRAVDMPAPQAAAATHSVSVQRAPSTPITVVIDAEAFARVFASVFATMLGERFTAWGAGMPAGPSLAQPPVAAPAKPSFWSQARHLDVLLMGLAMVIVLVVLAAWLV